MLNPAVAVQDVLAETLAAEQGMGQACHAHALFKQLVCMTTQKSCLCLQELLAEPLQQHVDAYRQEPVRPTTRTNAKALQAVLDEMLPEGALQVSWLVLQCIA